MNMEYVEESVVVIAPPPDERTYLLNPIYEREPDNDKILVYVAIIILVAFCMIILDPLGFYV